MLASSSLAPLSLLQIETQFRDRIWRGDALGSSPDQIVSSGFDELDKALPGGGWSTHSLTELLLPAEGLGEIRLLSHSLKHITQDGRNILLVGPPYIPYMHAWESLNIDRRRILMVKVDKTAERLWVIEQGIKSAAFGAAICWLPEATPQAMRKLQIIARAAASLTFLFRPVSAQFESSAAPLRILLGPARRHTLSVRLLKRRGTPIDLPLYITLPQVRPFSSLIAPIPIPIPILTPTLTNAVDRSSLPDIIT
ncbi:MAG: translesion DNA synthesis-associated protein ImuA [Pseudomonadota bacterium]|nr:translesion DNA synthesis-associated protein ImuA [Pseudomonadota bacterium]